jgi:peptidoglycan/xylan/chitin deacetylase (PgdA/CDA1 family)
MARRHFTLWCAAIAVACVASCSTPPPTAAKSLPHTPLSTVSPTPSAAGTASPKSTPSPHPSTAPRPTSSPRPPHARPGVSGTVNAASLGIPGAGTLKIPAWPQQPGMRWRGPYGSQGSTGTTSVALTFDDGPGPYTSRILDILDEYHVKATFCLIGRQIAAYRAVVRRMIADGMTLCDHTWDHDESLAGHQGPAVARDMQRMIDAVHAIDKDASVTYFRNPGGNFSPGTVRVSELLGMRPLYWSVDTADWTRPGVAAIEKTLVTHTHQDSIVLMHDGGGDRSESVTALRALLPSLKSRFHLIALPTARVVTVNPGTPAPKPLATTSPAPPAAG